MGQPGQTLQEALKDLALPPGYYLGRTPDGHLAVVRRQSSDIVGLDLTEEEAPRAVVAIWRDYLQEEASDLEIVRVVQSFLALEALASHEGDVRGGPRDRQTTEDGEHNFTCRLWGLDDDPSAAAEGAHDDLVMAILAARRVLEEGYSDEAPHEPDDEVREDDD